MADNEYINYLQHIFETDSDPYIRPSAARDAIQEDYPRWQDAVNDGLADYESAALMASFNIDNPYEIQEVGLNHENGNWTITVISNDEAIEIDLGSDDLPYWVWDWFYQMADDFGWDWEVSYAE